MDWRQAEIFDLICMYREYECLWNCLNPEYKSVLLKRNAWNDIAKFFGRDVEEVKKKVKNLRTSYVIEKKKADRKKNVSGDPLYEPKLFYFDEMTFLDPVIVLRFSTPTEQGADPLCEIKPKPSPNELHSAERTKRRVFSSPEQDNIQLELTPTKRPRDVDDVDLEEIRQDRPRKMQRDVDDVDLDDIRQDRPRKKQWDVDDIDLDDIRQDRPRRKQRDADNVDFDNVRQDSPRKRQRDLDDINFYNIRQDRPRKKKRDADDVDLDNIRQDRPRKKKRDADDVDLGNLRYDRPRKKKCSVNDVHCDNVLQDDLEKEERISKEDTFCAMLCSELKLLKSEDIYDNVTAEIFTILKNAKIAERQIVYQPEEINKISSKKM